MITPSFGLTATERVLPRMALDFTTASLDSRVTFTRTGDTATVVNSSGYVVGINADLPRFGFDSVTLACKGLLIEEARTNLLLYSSDYSNAAWTKGNADFGLTANATTAPDNTSTAFKMYEATTTNIDRFFFQVNKTIVASATTTVSIFLKAAENNYAQIRLANGNGTFGIVFANVNLSTGAIIESGAAGTGAALTASSITAFGNGWYRVTLTGSLNVNVTQAGLAVFMHNGTTTTYAGVVNNGFFIWGAQIEAGAFPTSYIPTEATAVTRNADVATMTGTNFSDWFNATEGTFDIESTAMAVGGASVATYLFEAANSSSLSTDFIAVYKRANADVSTRYQVRSDDISSVFSNLGTFTLQNRVACSYKTDYFVGALNGATPVSSTSGNTPIGVDTLNIGANKLLSAGAFLNGHVQKLNYWPQKLTIAEIQAFSK
jgi:hypothetical protein